MNSELPVLRLGLAGFTDLQQQQAAAMAQAQRCTRAQWTLAPLAEADAILVEGSRTQQLADGTLRIAPGTVGARSLQIVLAEIDRPIAFSRPVAARHFQAPHTFDFADPASCRDVLRKFTAWLQPTLAQFNLASSIVEHQPSIGTGAYEVLRGSDLIAVIDLSLGTAVSPDATPGDFEDATWCIRDRGGVEIPEHFAHASLSQLMWQYVARTERDLLPKHYRTRPLYFRRPPRLPQRLLKDAHLFLLRELAAAPGQRFAQLQRAMNADDATLARHLASLYYVGAITANPRRAGGNTLERRPDDPDSGTGAVSGVPSQFEPGMAPPLRRPVSDLTAPAQLPPE
jgi:hypothetical protein